MKPQFIVCVACCTVAIVLSLQGMNLWVRTPYSQLGVLQTGDAMQPGSFAKTDIRKPEFAPTSVYKQESVRGFTVLINPTVLAHPQDARAMQQELDLQLAAISRVMPAKPLSVLQKVRLWVEWANREGAAEFHPSAVWLRQNGYNPDKAGGVEVSNARNFVQWSRTDQPWLILHELAHAYHHLVLGDANADIRTAYQHAIDQGLYQSVDYIKGGKQRAYALTDDKEYFAELSESYFGRNDFYPFTSIELKAYDPVGYYLMEKSWGKLQNAESN